MADQISLKKETNLYDDEKIKSTFSTTNTNINNVNTKADTINNKIVSQYAVCNTGSSTAAKVATVDGTFSLYKNARVSVYFANANTTNSPTLNVDGTGAKPIWAYGGALSASGNTFNWVEKSTIEFVYDGSHWIVVDSGAVGLISKYDEKLNQEVVFNKLTNDGVIKGIFMKSGQLYINMDYLQTGTLKLGGANNGNGLAVVYNSSGTEIGRWDMNGLKATGDLSMRKTMNGVTYGATLGEVYIDYNDDSVIDDILYGFSISGTSGGKTFTSGGDFYTWSSEYGDGIIKRILIKYLSPNLIIQERIASNNSSWIWERLTKKPSPTYFTYTSRLTITDDSFNFHSVSGTDLTVYDTMAQIKSTSSTYFQFSTSQGKLQLTSSVYATLSSSGLYVNGKYVAYQTSSSKRYKHDITKNIAKEIDVHKLYDLPMKQFVYNDDFKRLEYEDMKGQTLPGFIAEDVAEIYPVAVIHNSDGEIESWDERRIIPGMLALIQEQKKQLDEQDERIRKLENNTSFIHAM